VLLGGCGLGGSGATTPAAAPVIARPIDTRTPALRHLQAVLLSEMAKAGHRSGADVTDLSSGEILFSLAAGVARPAASIEQLYTAAGRSSPGAQTSPAGVVSLLGAVTPTAIGRRLEASLPEVGVSGAVRAIGVGTTAAGHCRAALRTARAVSNIAGWCTARDHHTLAFAFFIDGPPSSIAERRFSRMLAAVAAY
jgi:hypothetical protein